MLKTKLSCEIHDLIEEVKDKSGKPYDEVKSAFFSFCLYPESRKTFLMHYPWLEDAFQSIFNEGKFESIYVTEAI